MAALWCDMSITQTLRSWPETIPPVLPTQSESSGGSSISVYYQPGQKVHVRQYAVTRQGQLFTDGCCQVTERLAGPTVHHGAIMHDEVPSTQDRINP